MGTPSINSNYSCKPYINIKDLNQFKIYTSKVKYDDQEHMYSSNSYINY